MEYRGSIRFKLMAFLTVILLISIFCMSAVILINLKESKVNDVSSRILELNQAVITNIETFLQEKSYTVSTVRELSSEMDNSTEAIRALLGAAVNNDPDIVNIYLGGASDGSMIMEPDSELPEGFDPRERPWYKGAIETGELHYSDIYIDVVTNEPVITVALPVTDDDNNITGVLGADLSLADLTDMINIEMHTLKGTLAYVTDANGMIIAHPDGELIEQQVDYSSNAHVEKTLTDSCTMEIIDVDGVSKFVFCTKLDTTGWGLFTEIEESTVFAPITNAVKRAVFYGFIVLVATLLLGMIVTRRYLTILDELNHITKVVADGDLTTRGTNLRTNDELGQVAESVEIMQKNLRDIVQGLVDSATRLANTTLLVKDQMQQTSEGAVETASTMARMADNVEHITQHSQQVANDADKMAVQAKEGRQEVGHLSASMDIITQDTAGVSDVITNLAEKSQEISDFIDVITGIAEQTNLLALNAAIESARAGEMGRGFAVVADEVGKLAEESARAAHEIKDLVLEMQTATNGALSAIENNTTSVNNGSGVVERTGRYFMAIMATIEGLTGEIRDVAQATEQMSGGIMDVSATAQEQSATMEEVSATTEELAALTKELEELARRFKI